MKITAQSPCRVDLAGGTLDIWPLYLFHANAVTVNFAVDRYTSCEVVTRTDSQIVLRSADQKGEETFASLDELRATKKYKLPLLAWVVRYFRPTSGIELSTNSEAPTGAGISGSSSLIITIASALNKLTGAGHNIEKIREISQNIEAQIIRVPTGCQDYYPAMYGGVSAIELTEAGIERKAIAVDVEDFNSRVVLAYTGKPRNSGINNWEVTKAHIDGDKSVQKNFDRISAISYALRLAMEKADWPEVARCIREEWLHRRKNAPGITTDLIDRLISVTKKPGAVAAKVCGAGGGGCVFFLVEPGTKLAVTRSIEETGATVLPVSVAPRGVRMRTAQ
ncbi:MAG: GHMP kinase [Bryobacteraceae bacterium]|nr:GHMP kinase [Bryobacteraceae bacterium]